VCERLAELREAVAGYAARFDPSLLTGADAAQVIKDAAAIENMVATIKALAATWVADTGVWRYSGDRSAAHHLARASGTSVGAAVEAIDTARRLDTLPDVAARARVGDLSAAQTSAIAGAAAADPRAASRLLEQSQRASLAELREECARVKAAAQPDLEQRRARIHQQRCLRSYTDSDGAWNMRVRNNPEVGAQIMAALAPIVDRLFCAARAEGRREPLEAYAADALAELAAGGDGERGGRGVGVKLIARADLTALLRGYPIEGETVELVGYGPVAVSAIRDLIDTGDPFLAAIATKGQAVVGVAHLGRRPTALQQTALEWLYPACAVEGCAAQAHLEIDHRVDWADTHFTLLELLDRLCKHHHYLKTHEGWALVEGNGKRAFVPPDDPRHPRKQA
jgi:hypothetical protein